MTGGSSGSYSGSLSISTWIFRLSLTSLGLGGKKIETPSRIDKGLTLAPRGERGDRGDLVSARLEGEREVGLKFCKFL